LVESSCRHPSLQHVTRQAPTAGVAATTFCSIPCVTGSSTCR
jgi:hypothetical protein